MSEVNATTSKADAVSLGIQHAAERFARIAERCEALAPKPDDQRQLFFDQSLKLQAHFLAAASACTAVCVEAYLARQDKVAYDRWMQTAQAAADTMSAQLKEADPSGPLKGWYAAEKIFGLQGTREMIQRRVSGKVMPRIQR